ncbi:MAG: hypothetical protein IPP49_08950 [Saprospiraceae bacterium]|nr:hypothetical protein [Saprospiraceae bacterium]
MFKELEVSSTGVTLTFLALVLLTIGLIVYFKRKYRSYGFQELMDANKNVKAKSLSERTKFPEVDVFKNAGSFFNFVWPLQ